MKDRPIILAIEYDGELGILTFENEEQALSQMRTELEAYLDYEEDFSGISSTSEVWDVINGDCIPLNFRILDTRVSDRSLF